MSTPTSPIGVFDSGVGGLSIWKEIHDLMPNESTVYLADSQNAPYGEKPIKTIIELSVKNTELLLSEGAKIIVVACNTATTNAIHYLRTHYNVPFIGIEPATKPAAIATRTGRIGILATKGTLASELFLNTSSNYRGNIKIIETIGTGLVPIVESGEPEKARPLLKKYLQPMIDARVDNIVLGCSHYPFLIDTIKSIIPEGINVIDSGAPVARHTKSVLAKLHLLSQSKDSDCTFYTNGDLDVLKSFLDRMKVSQYTANQKEF